MADGGSRMTDQELVEKIEKAMRVLGDFWKASEEEQRFALDISIACMRYILRTMEGSR
jgi:hypothetical protein